MAIFINYYRLKENMPSGVPLWGGHRTALHTEKRSYLQGFWSNFMSVMPVVSVFYYYPNTRRLLLSWFLEVLSHLKTVKLRFENGQLRLAAITQTQWASIKVRKKRGWHWQGFLIQKATYESLMFDDQTKVLVFIISFILLKIFYGVFYFIFNW